MKIVRWCLCLLNLVQMMCNFDILDDVDDELIRMWDGDYVEIVNLYWECQYISLNLISLEDNLKMASRGLNM